MEFSVVKKIACPENDCGHFGRTDNIRKHLISVHHYNDEQMKEFAKSMVFSRAKTRCKGVWKCPKCDHLCNSKPGVIRHIKINHTNEQEELLPNISFDRSEHQEIKVVQRILRRHSNPDRESKELKYKCPFDGCTDSVTSRTILVFHAREKHSSPNKKFILTREHFDTEKEFEDWFAAKKLETNGRFSVKRSYSDGIRREVNYGCSSEGKYRPTNPDKPKMTCRTSEGKVCTAFVNVSISLETGAHSVYACLAHTDHAIKPRWVRKKSTAPRKSRAKSAQKLPASVTNDNTIILPVPNINDDDMVIDGGDIYGDNEIDYEENNEQHIGNEIEENLGYVRSTIKHIEQFMDRISEQKNEQVLEVSRKLQEYINDMVDVANQYLTKQSLGEPEPESLGPTLAEVLNKSPEENPANRVPKPSSFCQLCKLPVSPYENLIRTADSWHNCYSCGVKVHEKCFIVTGKDECRSCQYGMYVKIPTK